MPRAPDDSLVASAPVELVAGLGRDSVAPEQQPEDWLDDSLPELAVPVALHSPPDVRQWASPAYSEAPASPLVEPPHWRPDARSALHCELRVVRDARPKPAAVWQKG